MPRPPLKRKRVVSFKSPKSMQVDPRTKKAIAKASEAHFVDLAQASYALDTTGSIVLIATIPEGVDVNSRVGKKAFYKSLQMRGNASANTAGVINDCAVLIVYDKRPRGSLPAITDILNTASSRSFNNDANSDRFEIVSRVDFTLVGNSTNLFTNETAKNMDKFINLRMRRVQFEAAGTGAIDDLSQGALYLVTVGSNPAGTTAAAVSLGFRTRFYDN